MYFILLQKKCEKYWPSDDAPTDFIQFLLIHKDERQFAFYVYREISLENKMVIVHITVYKRGWIKHF